MKRLLRLFVLITFACGNTQIVGEYLQKALGKAKKTGVTLKEKIAPEKNKHTIDLKTVTPYQGQASTTPHITVWIHGTALIGKNDSKKAPKQGLQTISSLASLAENHRLTEITQLVSSADPINYPLEHFYAFGWTGALSFNDRLRGATLLHRQLKELIATYTKKYSTAPFVRIITTSHGGNVALNLAKIEDTNPKLFINELILLACPVQEETKDSIASPLFGKVYSLYSTRDTIQVADPQGLRKKGLRDSEGGFFSQRRFADNKKLVQVELKLNHLGPMHIGFRKPPVTKRLPAIIRYLEQWEKDQPHTTEEIRQLTVLVPRSEAL